MNPIFAMLARPLEEFRLWWRGRRSLREFRFAKYQFTGGTRQHQGAARERLLRRCRKLHRQASSRRLLAQSTTSLT
jgi:hypothetical protein